MYLRQQFQGRFQCDAILIVVVVVGLLVLSHEAPQFRNSLGWDIAQTQIQGLEVVQCYNPVLTRIEYVKSASDVVFVHSIGHTSTVRKAVLQEG